MSGPHERAVRADLRRLHPEDRKGGLSALALTLARHLDDGGLTSRDLATVSAQLKAILETLAKKQEPAAVLDPVQQKADEIAARRARRLGQGAATASG